MKSVVFKTVSGSPDTTEWHAWRMGGIGGSDAPILAADAGLLADKPAWMKSANHLFLIKTGQKEQEDLSNNPAVRRGKENEEPARKLFEERTGILLSPCFGEMESHPFVRASFDGLTFERDALAEIKVASQKVHELAKFGRVVDYYKPQIAHQALVAWEHPESWSDQMTYFISYNPEADELVYVEKPARDYRALAEKLLEVEIKFWASVEQRIPPCGAEWIEAAAKYIAVNEQLDLVKAEVETAKARLIELLGSAAKMEGGGVSLVRTVRAGNVDYVAAVKDLMPGKSDDEIKEFFERYRKEGGETLTVRIEKPRSRKEKPKQELV
jgi:putative phage-type endonuclease